MACCDTVAMTANRNADFRRTIAFRSGYNLAGYSARMQVRESEGAADPALLTVTMTPTANGSFFTIFGYQVILSIFKEDLQTFPVADPVSDPIYLVYDIVLTDDAGFENYLFGGDFIVEPGVTQ